MRTVTKALFLVGIFASGICAADATLRYAIIEAGEPVEGKRIHVAVGEGMLAISHPSDTGRASVLFRAEEGEVFFIDHKHREYTVMTEAWLAEANERAEKTLEQMRSRMEEQGENMSPQARKQMSQADSMMRLMPLMGGMYGGGSANKATYSRTYRRSEFNGLSCEQYDELLAGERQRIVCLADPGSIGLATEDAVLVRDFIDTLARMYTAGLPELGFEMPVFALYADGLDGVPIAASSPENNGFVLVDKADPEIRDALFKVPETYLKAEIPLFGF